MAVQDGGQLRIDGARQLRRTLKQAGADMKELSALNKQAAAVVAEAAKPATPLGPAKGGHMARTVRAGATQRAGVVRVGNKRMVYPGRVHYGDPDGTIKPNPWLIDAAKATEPRWTGLYWSGLLRILSKIEGDKTP